ncbi:recombinase family protein [Candidatus Methylospira mobilis]|nr:recombinase family protein [Candidatus Methylospira mobilis]
MKSGYCQKTISLNRSKKYVCPCKRSAACCMSRLYGFIASDAARIGFAVLIASFSRSERELIAALRMAGCEYIFTDTAIGALSKRSELTRSLGSLRTGDTLVAWKPGRLGPGLLPHLVTVLADLQKQRVA